jgi:hypothetical protein
MTLLDIINAVGTSEGAERAWDTRGRGRKPPHREGDINDMTELRQHMKKPEYMDGRYHVVSVVFGKPFVKSYKSVGAIPYNAIGDAGPVGGYFHNGELKSFPQHLKIKYQNSALGMQ